MKSIVRLSSFVLVLVICFALAVGTLWAQGSQEGALRAAFQSQMNAMLTLVYAPPNDRAVQVSAPTNGVEGRIVPFVPNQTFCSDTVLGTWVGWYYPQENKEQLAMIYSEFEMEGEPLLDLERTPLKRFSPPAAADDPDGERYFGFTEGVPVLGTFEPGTYTLDWSAFYSGEPLLEVTITFEVVDCG
jgi:hypothetical protein